MIDRNILKNEERFSFSLRSLYNSFGYERYKMNKFEEYELYVRNKDFLISESVITFTDTNGKLLALKPDVTLSIIKNTKDKKGFVEKLYYDEHVYRISKDSHSYKEIAQTGLECIGDLSLCHICEVVYLAAMSLKKISSSYILDLSHAGLVRALFDCLSVSEEKRSTLLSFINSKSPDAAFLYIKNEGLSTELDGLCRALMSSYKDIEALERALAPFACDSNALSCLKQFREIYLCLCSLGLKDRINIDFSIVGDVSYYSGTLFKGYIEGISTSVLSGGQYDKLMEKMGKASGAIGFAVYLDLLERFDREEKEYDYDTLVLFSEKVSPHRVIETVSSLCEKGERAIALKDIPQGVRYNRIITLKEDKEND